MSMYISYLKFKLNNTDRYIYKCMYDAYGMELLDLLKSTD